MIPGMTRELGASAAPTIFLQLRNDNAFIQKLSDNLIGGLTKVVPMRK